MGYLFCGIAALIFGVLAGWAVSMKRASAAEALVAELRQTAQKAAEDFERLRLRLSEQEQLRVRAETENAELSKRLEEEKKLLDEIREKFTNTFKALAGDALNQNRDAFLALAQGTFEKVLEETKGDLGRRQEAISGLVKPLSESLQKFDEQVRRLETARQSAYTGLDTRLEGLADAQKDLRKETANLAAALKDPQARGQWGELLLERVLELGGLPQHYVLVEQSSFSSEGGNSRPDAVIFLSNDRAIIVDAKAPLLDYQEAFSAKSDEERKNALKRHAQQMRTYMNDLSRKNYSGLEELRDKTLEYVAMFVPGEPFLTAAMESDRQLIEDAIKKRILLVTPNTLFALILVVAHTWRQQDVAKNAQAISELGKDLYERLKILANYITGIGDGLEKANRAYNSAIGSIDSRVLPAARKFKEFGVSASEEIPPLKAVENSPRRISSSELSN